MLPLFQTLKEWMMDKKKVNRIEVEVAKWKEEESRFKTLFSFDVSTNKGLLRKKLRDFEDIAAKYRKTNDPAERLSLMALKQERRHLERVAYTNTFIRLFRRLIILPIRRQILIVRQNRMKEMNEQKLTQILSKLGLKSHNPAVRKHIDNDETTFSIPAQQYVNGTEKLNSRVSFEKDVSGEYKLSSHEIGLGTDAKGQENHNKILQLSADLLPNSKESYNLLQGRSVQIDGKWIKLDLNDQDPNGKYKIKEIQQLDSFALVQSIEQLGLKQFRTVHQIEHVAGLLRQGERVPVVINRRRYELEANPQFKTIDVYDECNLKLVKSVRNGKVQNTEQARVTKVDKLNERSNKVRLSKN